MGQALRPMSERGQLLAYVVAPIVMLWLLLLFAPNDLSMMNKLGVGGIFTGGWGPLMFLRVRNR